LGLLVMVILSGVGFANQRGWRSAYGISVIGTMLITTMMLARADLPGVEVEPRCWRR
jgi:K+ transporter